MIFDIFEDPVRFLEVLGVWLAAIATFTAAWVALRVANRANRQSLEVTAKPMVIVQRGLPDSSSDIFMLSVTNKGLRRAKVTHLCIKATFPRFNGVLMEGVQPSSPLPTFVEDGETATWQYPKWTPDGSNWYRGLINKAAGDSWFRQQAFVLSVRFYVMTSLGNRFFAVRTTSLRKELRKSIALQREESR